MRSSRVSKLRQYITKLANVSVEDQQAQAQTPNGDCCYVCQERLCESSHLKRKADRIVTRARLLP